MPRRPQLTVHSRALVALALGAVLAACGGATPTQPPTAAAALTPHPRTATPRPSATTAAATQTRDPLATDTSTPAISPTPTLPTNTVVERGVLPPGFSLTVYGEVLRPTSLTFGPDGRLYVASRTGQIFALRDADGDRRAEHSEVFVSNLTVPLGLLWIDDALYVSYKGAVAAVRDTDGDGVADAVEDILTGLPSQGLHQNDGLVLAADGYIYMGQGSTCDHCPEADARNGAILRFRPDGTEFSVYASGLRNPYDVALNAAGDLFATDNGRDDLGLDLPPEELNLIRAGQHYGWPDCWTGNPDGPCATQAEAVATFTAHTSANGLTFYNGGQFPAEYADNAFVAILGAISMLPDHPEHGLVRVQLTPAGDSYTSVTSWFLTLPDGRPLDVTVGPDGALYVADYINNEIYRIVYGAP